MLILFCNCSYSDIISQDTKDCLRRFLQQHHALAMIVPDLCEMVAQKNPRLLAIPWEETTIVACYPRAIRALLEQVGIIAVPKNIYNMRELGWPHIMGELAKLIDNNLTPAPPDAVELPQTTSWAPWFPVIEHSRCIRCQQCLNFCLFGVYDKDSEGNIIVKKPTSCKNHCPACARICPTGAIIFPKCPDTPICGDNIPANYKPTNIDKLLGENPQETLYLRRLKAKAMLEQKKKM